MKGKPKNHLCALCKGNLVEGKTTFTADIGTGVVVIRDVPALVCDLCGEDWIMDDVAQQLEAVTNAARKKKNLVEVLPFSA